MPNTLKVYITTAEQWDKEIKAAKKKGFSFQNKEPKFSGYKLIVYHCQERIMTPLIDEYRAGYLLFHEAAVVESISKVKLKQRAVEYKRKIRVIMEFDDMHELINHYKEKGLSFKDNKIYSAAIYKKKYRGLYFDWITKRDDFIKSDILSRQLELDFSQK